MIDNKMLADDYILVYDCKRNPKSVILSFENIVDIQGALRDVKDRKDIYKAECFDETFEKIMAVPVPNTVY